MKLSKLHCNGRTLKRIMAGVTTTALLFSLGCATSGTDTTASASTETETAVSTVETTEAATAEGDMTTPPEKPDGDGQGMGGQGGSSASITYSAANTYSEDAAISGESISSTGTDENAVLVEGGSVTVEDSTITRESGDSTGGDNASFYGVGATLLVTDGTLTVEDSTITSDARGAAGVFAYGDGTAYVSDTVISTEQDTSGGIHVAGGGTLYADNVTATTKGESSAAIRSDRGGGLMVVTGGDFTSNGTGSPAVYCTATIVAEDANLVANGSEAVCIEGLNSLYLYDCNLTGNMPENAQNDTTWNVILYQSMSGDSQVGNSTFQMVGGTLTAKNGGMFYTTNTESTFIIKDVTLVYADGSEYLLRCTGNANARGWGQSGANGADCTFTAISQELEGDVIYDSISNLTMYLTDGSVLKGAFQDDESCAGNGGDGTATLYVSADSTWVVTGDSTLTSLYNAGSVVDADGNQVTIVGTDGTVYVSGTSPYTVTVKGYSTEADLSGASQVTAFEDAQVNNGSTTTDGMGMGGDMTPPDGMGNGTPPEMPDGNGQGMGGPGSDGSTPPEKPDGDGQGMGDPGGDGTTPPEKPGSNS